MLEEKAKPAMSKEELKQLIWVLEHCTIDRKTFDAFCTKQTVEDFNTLKSEFYSFFKGHIK